MSYNQLFDRKAKYSLEAIYASMDPLFRNWKDSFTLEQKLSVEAEILYRIEQLLTDSLPIEYWHVGEHLSSDKMLSLYSAFDINSITATSKVRNLSQRYLDIYNTSAFHATSLIGKIRRVHQKLSVLAFWEQAKAKHLVVEKFENWDVLGTQFVSLPACDVKSNEGILTLPVDRITELPLKKIVIGSNSNGLPGNSDIEVVQKQNSTNSLLRKDDTWFEYERLDSGPLKLELNIELDGEQILNSIEIELAGETPSGVEVADIWCVNEENQKTSIRDLTANSNWALTRIQKDVSWNVSFLPTKAKSIVISFVQRSSYLIDHYSADRKIVQRERFSIGLRRIRALQRVYAVEGGMGSKPVHFSSGLYAAFLDVESFPPQTPLHDIWVDVSTDAGQTWETRHIGVNNDPILLDGQDFDLLWKLSVVRNSNNFKSTSSYTNFNPLILDVGSTSWRVTQQKSPIRFALPESPADGRVIVLETDLLKRGDNRDLMEIADPSNGQTMVRLPVSLSPKTTIADLQVTVNRRKLQHLEAEPVSGSWRLGPDLREVELPLSESGRVQAVLKPEEMRFETQDNYYLHRTEYLFDPDKNKIRVEYLKRNQARKTEILPRDRRTIKLQKQQLMDSTAQLVSLNGTAWTQVTQRSQVDRVSNSFYVDPTAGTLYLSEESGNDSLRISYTHQDMTVLKPDDFKIGYEDLLPIGILIPRDQLEVESVTEIVDAPLRPYISIKERATLTKLNLFNSDTTVKNLSNKNIIVGSVTVSQSLISGTSNPVEVPFIDGRSEFKGLLVSEEETTEIAAGPSLEYVEFQLAAGSLWDRTAGITFDDTDIFIQEAVSTAAARTGTTGDWYVSDAGIVTINVGITNSLTSGVRISYYYQNTIVATNNKYSVDYTEGVLYASANLNAAGVIHYQVAHYTCAYSVAQQIQSAVYVAKDNSIEFRVEELSKPKTAVRAIWIPSDVENGLTELEPYYSPLIESLSVRFN